MTRRRACNLTQIAALVALVGLLAGCNTRVFQFAEPLHEETRTSQVPHQANAAVEVTAVNGSVEVSQTDRYDVEIVAHLKAVSAERIEAAKVVAERQDNGMLAVSVEWPEGKRRNREGCSFEIRIPDAVDATLRTSNGKIVLAGLSGNADLRTSNGVVEVRGHDGPLTANTSNGQIKAFGVRGTINASTSNGRIEIADAISRVDAETSNGTIDVSLAPQGPGPIEARTSNGSIHLSLSPAVQGRLTLKTSNGSLKVDPSFDARVVSRKKNQAELEFGGPEPRSSATTSNGSIHLKPAKNLTL